MNKFLKGCGIAFLSIIVLGIVGNILFPTETDIKVDNDTQNKQLIKQDKTEPNKTKKNITYESYLAIENGMTYGEVKEILGEGEEFSKNKIGDIVTVAYQWNAGFLKSINVTFQNGKVAMKTQVGLDKK